MKRIIKEIRLLAVKNSAYEIINKKHATYYGMAMSVKRICEVIMRNEKSILPVSHIIHGVYDIDGVSLSMPVIVGVDGIESNIPIEDRGMCSMFPYYSHVVTNCYPFATILPLFFRIDLC